VKFCQFIVIVYPSSQAYQFWSIYLNI